MSKGHLRNSAVPCSIFDIQYFYAVTNTSPKHPLCQVCIKITAYGGVGLSLLHYLKVVEKVVKLDMSLGITALAHLSIGTKGIVLFGSQSQKRKYLVPAAVGEMIFSYALTEPKTGSDAQNIETTATLSDDGEYYVLTGQKAALENCVQKQRHQQSAALGPGECKTHTLYDPRRASALRKEDF